MAVVGKICNIEVIIEGVNYKRRIALAKPDSGGLNPIPCSTDLMVHGTMIGTQEDNRWHYFPLRNIVSYNVKTEEI